MEYGVLILVHVVSGTLWASIAFFFGVFLVPALGEAGPAAGAVMGGLMKRKMPVFLTVCASLAVLSGLRLYMIRFSGVEWVLSPEGLVLTLGALASLHVYVKGLLVSRPLAERLGALGAQLAQAQGQPDPALVAEMQAGQAKMARIGRSSAYELLAVLILMAGHRLASFF